MDKILEPFINEPEREFHIRELARINRKAPTTVSKYLFKYEKKGLLTVKKRFNHLLYRASFESPIFRQVKLFYNLKKLRESGLINYLTEEFNNPEAIVLFGSFRKAEDIPKSDIDLLIITSSKREGDLTKYENILKHKIQLFLYSRNDIDKIKIKNKELLNSFINGIVLEGFWELFR